MGANLTRLKRLVREANARQREDDEEHEKYAALLAGCLLAHSPGLRLVEPCDTDPETYARIQETIAKAECRTRDARRWQLVYEPVPPPKYTGTTPEEFRDYFNTMAAEIPERCEREQQAVEAAKKRLGSKAGTKMHDVSPAPPEA